MVVSFIKQLYLTSRLFMLAGLIIFLFIISYIFPFLFSLSIVLFIVWLLLLLVDILMMFRIPDGIVATRHTPEKFSNGDPNLIRLMLENRYPYQVKLEIIDEVPYQFQWRDNTFHLDVPPQSSKELNYELRPVTRGEYHFGVLNVYASGPLDMVKRRYREAEAEMVPCYPAYIQMRTYQLMAISNRLSELGVKPIRRLGHTTEFEQIKEYVRGDDYRTINWKATARARKLMVNQYTDERSQHVYCLIDKSRVMKMPFEGMSLLDHAINASLVISNIALYKKDKAGLITFSESVDAIVPADHRTTQMFKIQEVLYNQQSRFLEAAYERLYVFVKRKLTHRSLLILFTNFESLTALRRQLPFLQQIARQHLLMVIFFENTELSSLLSTTPKNTEEIYIKTIGEHFAFEKKQIVHELKRHGIISILTPPQNLTVNTLNKYLELKSRRMI